MIASLRQFCIDPTTDAISSVRTLYGILAAINFGAWFWAIAAFHDRPALLGAALLVYGLGLRHAVDVDHIVAIDNVTRKLLQAGRQPEAAGFFFAMGHSSVVTIAAAAVALSAQALDGFDAFKNIGAMIGASVSALFLFAIAATNLLVFFSVFASYRDVLRGDGYREADLDRVLDQCGFLTRLLRPVLRLVTQSWHMFPLGVLFGLGFDTAAEVAVFGVAAAQAARDVSVLTLMVFPLLFAAAMSLIDTADGLVMLKAYRWARLQPTRKLAYNMTITFISALAALVIAGIETLSLASSTFGLSGSIWSAATAFNFNATVLGLMVVALVLATWGVFYASWRFGSRGDIAAPKEAETTGAG